MLQQCYNNKFNAKLLCEVVSVGLCAWTICSLFQLKRYQCSMTFHIYSHRMLPLCSIGCCIHPISFANSCGIAISPIAKKNPENCKFYLKSLHFNWEGIINSSMTKRNCIQTHTHNSHENEYIYNFLSVQRYFHFQWNFLSWPENCYWPPMSMHVNSLEYTWEILI